MINRNSLTILCIVFGCIGYSQAQEVTTVILVRHAEKGIDEAGDPDLTEEGVRRSEELLRVLQNIKIDAIYSTPFKRTRQTVLPLAKRDNAEILEYNPFKLDEVLSLIEKHKGNTILLSGHSNTTPIIINMLIDEDTYRQLDDADYDNLYIVSYIKKGEAKVLSLEYGYDSEL